MLGGELSPDIQADEAKFIHVLDTNMYVLFVIFFGQRSSLKQSSSFTRNPIPTLSSIVRRQQMLEWRTVLFLSNELPLETRASPPLRRLLVNEPLVCHRDAGTSGRPRHVPGEDNKLEGSTKHHAKLVAPDGPSRKETARSKDGRLIELERQLSETLIAKSERDRRIAQLADDLAKKSALHEQAAEERKRARLELRKMQTKIDESLLSRDHVLEQA